jgi:hypothetical protein
MHTRRSWRNQERLWRELGREGTNRPEVKPMQIAVQETQSNAVVITDMVNFIASFPKGTEGRRYAGDYCDWLLKARSDQPRSFDYHLARSRAKQITATCEYLFSVSRRVTVCKPL